MRTVRLSEKIERDLEDLANQKNVSKSSIIKEALEEYIAIQKKINNPYRAGEELFGKYASNENDRSVTYKSKVRSGINEKHTR